MAKNIDPRLTSAMHALASGQVEQADVLCRGVLQDKRRDDLAMALLAQVCNQSGKYEEALGLIRNAIAKNGKRADYHGLLADLLATRGDFKGAISAYDKALKYQPQHPGVLAGKANTWLRLDEPEKARKLLEPCMKGGLEDLTIATVFSKSLIAMGEYDAAAAVLLNHLPAEKEPVESRRTLYFVLGSAMEKAGEYKSAFEAYEQANILSLGGFDPKNCTRIHDDLIAAFPVNKFSTMPISSQKDDTRVFIVGMPRCGSTLTEQIIDAHPDGIGLGEIEVLQNLLLNAKTRDSFADMWSAMNPQSLDDIATQYLESTNSPAKKIVDKQLSHFQFVGAIATLFPNAKIIHCTRNPMSMGFSCFAQKFAPSTNAWASSLHNIGNFYNEYNRLMQHWQELLGERMFTVQYEDLVQDQEAQTRRILSFCNLDFHERCMRFWETGRTVLTLSQDQVRKPMYDSSVLRHERFGKFLDPLRKALEM